METYYGYIKTQLDAILLFEACRLGVLPRVQRRLSERERLQIKSGSIYVWNEAETGMKRWTDGKPWSASRVSGSFLTYREMENRAASPPSALNSAKKLKVSKKSESSGMEYKVGGLYKQSFSLTTSDGTKFHLISYYKREDINRRALTQPAQDPSLKCINIPIDFYPDNASAGNQLGPAVIKGPMASHISMPIPIQHQYQSMSADPQQQQQHMSMSHYYATPRQTSVLAPGHVQYQFYSAAPPPPPPGPLHFHPQHLPSASSSPHASTHIHRAAQPAHPPHISQPSPPSQRSSVSTISSSQTPHSLPPVRFPSPPTPSYSQSPQPTKIELAKSTTTTGVSKDSQPRAYNSAEDKRALQRLDQGFMV